MRRILSLCLLFGPLPNASARADTALPTGQVASHACCAESGEPANEQTEPIDQHRAAEQLRWAGAEVTLTQGLITGVAAKDLAKFTDAEF